MWLCVPAYHLGSFQLHVLKTNLPFTFCFDVQWRKELLKDKPFLPFIINIAHSLLL